MKHSLSILGYLVLVSLVFGGPTAFAQDDIEALRNELAGQKKQLTEQMRKIEDLEKKLNDAVTKAAPSADERGGGAKAQAETETARTAKGKSVAPTERSESRDTVGDLNAAAVKAGEFPGSMKIPGTGDVSLAIGGFIKTVAIFDSEAENMGADFLPAILGTRRPDNQGGFSMDATLTRLHLDARAPVPRGNVRGYVEADLNSTNDGSLGLKLRQAYGSWTTGTGTLVAGQTWSTLMDLKILPEGLTEPTVSGVIFMRQPIIRWSQPLNPQFIYHIAIEDASSNDVFSEEPSLGNTSLPDVIAGLDFTPSDAGHLRLNGILRKIEVDIPGSSATDDAVGWGLALTGHLKLSEKDRINFGGVYGEGLGRYLLGIQSIAGAAVNPANKELSLRDNWGGVLTYAHHWTETLRSTAMAGYAHTEPFGWQAGNTFESSTYAAVNLMWSIQPFLTLGVEYAYGNQENKDGSDLDNHRIGLGIQVF